MLEQIKNQVANTKLIAEFMGYKIIDYQHNKHQPIYNGNKYAKTVGELRKLWGGLDLQFTGRFIENVQYPFHSDFRYLAPIIRRIEEQGFVVKIAGISYQIYKVMDEGNPIVSLVCGDLSKKTEMVYHLIIEFLKEQSGTKEIKTLKRPVKVPAIIIALLLVSITSFAQPSIGMKLLSNGVGMDLGFLIDNKVDVQLSTMGITGNNEKAKITTITAGYRVLLSRNELNNYSVTPSVGYGLYRVKDYTDYNNDPEGKAAVKQINLNYPALNINIAKDIHKGQIYIQANYCKFLYYGVGFRVYFYRKLLIQN